LNSCTNATCGDGYTRSGVEECDDGNSINNDGCTNACTLPVCGDSIINGTEQCDDGNTSNTDACLNSCLNATCGDGYTRSGVEDCDSGTSDSTTCDYAGGTGANACTAVQCGDGYTNTTAGEDCDTTTDTVTCDYNSGTGANACTSVQCGDGYINSTAGETCDTSVDTATCDYNSGTGPQACTAPLCGDNYTNTAAGEDCDGGVSDTTTCDYDSGTGANACTPVACGDGYINTTAGEDCDGGLVDTATCDYDSGTGANACTTAICGDSYTNTTAGEDCDGGSADTTTCDYAGGTGVNACTPVVCGDGYTNTAAGEYCETTIDTSVCDYDSGTGTNRCTAATCGDGYTNTSADEECDDGTADTATCDYASGGSIHGCSFAVCGDGYRNAAAGEMCDDGNTTTEECEYGLTSCDVCDSTCQIVAGETDFCGDAVIDTLFAEFCDEGVGINGTPLHCNTTCSGITVPGCGNGFVEPGETCDDGNTVTENCDYGLMSCEVCGSSCVFTGGITSYCGDNIFDPANEGCDDGDVTPTSGDGCSATCTIETGFACIENPVTGLSECEFHCGNGTLQTGAPFLEECDYGIPSLLPSGGTGPGGSYNSDICTVSAYGETCDWCGADCVINTVTGSYCGDGTVDSVEACDDGNLNNGDGCSNCIVDFGYTCTGIFSICSTVCGDGDCAAPSETCVSCPTDCEICNLTSPTVSEFHDKNLFSSVFEKIRSTFIKPEPKVKIPGVEFKEPEVGFTPLETNTDVYDWGIRKQVEVGGEFHHLTIEKIEASGSTIKFILESCPNKGSLKLNSAKLIDTNCDGINDVIIKYEGLEDGRPKISTTLLLIKNNKEEIMLDILNSIYDNIVVVISLISTVILF
jgi:cysteine-rich repeat protein